MRAPKTSIVTLTVLLIASPAAWAGDRQLTLDNTGRIVVPLTEGTGDVHIVVRGIADRADLAVACRPLPSFDNTAEPSADDVALTGTVAGRDKIFVLGGRSTAPFAFCSLRKANRVPLAPGEAVTLKAQEDRDAAQIDKLTATIDARPESAALRDATTKAQAATDAHNALVTSNTDALRAFSESRTTRIARLRADADAYKNPDPEGAVTELKRLQELIRGLQQEIDAETARLDALALASTGRMNLATTAQAAAQAKVDAFAESRQILNLRDAINKSIERRTKDADDTYQIHSVFHVFMASDDKPVFYRVLSTVPRTGRTTVIAALERAAPFPVFTTDSRPYAVVINYLRTDADYPFVLSFTTDKGTPPDLAPVRPTTQLSAQARDAHRFDTSRALRDFVMPFGGGFPPHTIIKASISSVLNALKEDSISITTSTPSDDGDGKTTKLATEVKNVQLIKDDLYPQIRPLYRFNFTTGVVFSFLRDPTNIRVKTELDDPATTDKKEDRYKDGTIKGDVSVIPMFAVTVYPTLLDISAPMSIWDRVRPSPTFGFAFVNPQENAFVGASIEPLRSMQFLVGVHVGKVSKERSAENTDKDDPASTTVKTTDKRFGTSLFIGASFNVNFVKTMFGK